MSKQKYDGVLYYLLCFFILINVSIINGENGKKISLTLEDLQKHFDLKKDKIELTWDEFKKIMNQIGNNTKLDYSIDDGVVTLKRSQFDLLLKKMTPVLYGDITPPGDYIINSTSYKGSSNGKNSKFTLNATVYIFKKGRYVSVPIISSRAAVSGIQINRKPGILTVKGGWYYANLKNTGQHNININFSITNIKQRFSFPIIRSSITKLDYVIPYPGYEFKSNSFVNPDSKQSTAGSSFEAYLASSNTLNLNWNLKREKIKKKNRFSMQNQIPYSQ